MQASWYSTLVKGSFDPQGVMTQGLRFTTQEDFWTVSMLGDFSLSPQRLHRGEYLKWVYEYLTQELHQLKTEER